METRQATMKEQCLIWLYVWLIMGALYTGHAVLMYVLGPENVGLYFWETLLISYFQALVNLFALFVSLGILTVCRLIPRIIKYRKIQKANLDITWRFRV